MNWKIDPGASRVEFATQQMMGLIRGQFRHVEGSLVYEPDQPEDPR